MDEVARQVQASLGKVVRRQRDAAEAGWEQVHLANGHDPHINDPADWIPNYPPAAGE